MSRSPIERPAMPVWPRIRCFSVADIVSAYRHLDLDASQCELVERHRVEMRAKVMGWDAR